MKEFRYKGYWVQIKRSDYSSHIEILITNNKLYFKDRISDLEYRTLDKSTILNIMKEIVEKGVKSLDIAIYPVTGRPT